MKRSLLARLRSNGAYYIVGALLLLVGVPLYQSFVLTPAGFDKALSAPNSGYMSAYLAWISAHTLQFVLYRALLLLAFALFCTLPFSLYRIIVAQEIMLQQERVEAARPPKDAEEDKPTGITVDDGMPANAWRGKGLAVIAVWAGMLGLALYMLGTIASTLYLAVSARSALASTTTLSGVFAITTNSVGWGFIAIAALFFGGMIVRGGHNLWPGSWVAFGYMALVVTLLLFASALEIAGAPTAGQSLLSSPATFLFALWVLWLGIMLMRLKPEA